MKYNINNRKKIKKKGKCYICSIGHYQKNSGLLQHHILPKTEVILDLIDNEEAVILCGVCHRHIHWLYKNQKKALKILRKYNKLQRLNVGNVSLHQAKKP